MQCPQCQADNPDQAKFCLECGTKLQAVCPECGAVLPVEAKFCFECGSKIGEPAAPPPAPPAPGAEPLLADALKRLVPQELAERLLATRGKVGGERRMVTLLFSDVKGSTAMGEQLDPEDLMDIMNGAFEVLIPPVYRYEGTLARLMGDAILAFFGAPLAHEDDAERAVRAALEIVDGAQAYAAQLERERGIKGFNVRVGINTGLVVVGEVGIDLRVEYTAMGDAINLAARMEQNAPIGGILISHDTYLQVRGLFEVQALEPITVKGKAEPVRVYTVQGARPRAFRLATRGVEGVETRMVGRDAELKRLQDAFYLALEDAECQVVTVVGEAGVGKTRLLWEFENWLDEQPAPVAHPTRHFHARANREMQSVPYALLRDLFMLRFDIQESDPVQTVHDKLELGIGRVLGWGEAPGDAQALGGVQQGQMKAHLIGQLLGFDFSHSPFVQEVGDDARQLRDRALIYLGEFLQTVAAVSTAIVLFEDIQWADDSSLDAIVHLASALARQRVLIVCLARPTLFDHRPLWGEGRANHSRIDLRPLSRRESRQLVAEILQKVEQVPATLRDLVVSGSEGNPLYVEELLKVLIEQGIVTKSSEEHGRWRVNEARLADLRVPPTLTGVLQARLDSLPLAQRGILQQAAVVGRTFWDLVVQRIGERSGDAWAEEEVPDVLSTLRGRELLAQHETSAFAGSREFVFKHAALREVAYESILKKVRRGYHSLVADWLMEQSGERASEYTGLIAEHLELAGRTEEALTYLRQAGQQAAAQFANAEAVDYFARALALLDEVEADPRRRAEARFALLLEREAVYWLLGQRDAEGADLAALRALAAELEEGGRPAAARRAELARRHVRYHEALSDFPAALANALEAVEWAEQAANPPGIAQALIQCGIVLWRQGQFDAARRPLEEALALAREHDDRQAEAGSLHNLGTVAYLQGDSQSALDHLEQALRIRRDLGERRNEAGSLNNLVVAYLGVGDLARALVGGEQTLAINQGIGDRHGEARALCNLAIVYHQVGALAQARDTHERALALARQLGDRSLEALTLSNLAHTLIDLGDPVTARQQCEQAVTLNRQTGDRRGEGYSLTHLAFALETLGELDAAAAAYEEALHLRREIGQEALAVDDLAGLAGLAARQGRHDEARAQAHEVLDWMSAHGVADMSYPVRAYVLAAAALAAAGEQEQAATALDAARALVQARAAKISDPDVRASFLQNVALHAQLITTS